MQTFSTRSERLSASLGEEKETTSNTNKEYITNDQWSPRQIFGYLRMSEGIEVSHQSIYNIIHNDTTRKLAGHTSHKMKYRFVPKADIFQ